MFMDTRSFHSRRKWETGGLDFWFRMHEDSSKVGHSIGIPPFFERFPQLPSPRFSLEALHGLPFAKTCSPHFTVSFPTTFLDSIYYGNAASE